jgi:hypothetical protein
MPISPRYRDLVSLVLEKSAQAPPRNRGADEQIYLINSLAKRRMPSRLVLSRNMIINSCTPTAS